MIVSDDLLIQEYFEYICEVLHCDSNGEYYMFSQLIERLWKTPYVTSNEYDLNRWSDGVSYRRQFAWKCDYPYSVIDRHPLLGNEDVFGCRMLEMMVALANKMEETLLDNWKEDRTYIWFWRMVTSLRLYEFDDSRFESVAVDEIIDRFMRGLYAPDGTGDLFTIYELGYDCRDHQIFDKMQKWVHENMVYYNPDAMPDNY